MSVVEFCRNHDGSLTESNQRILKQMLEAHREDLWNKAKRIVIAASPVITVDMAVRRIRSGLDASPPDPFTLYRAIRCALRMQEEYLVHGCRPDADN